MKIQITNHKVQEARANGDYLTEQAVFVAPYEPYPQLECSVEDKVQDVPMKKYTLSELIEKYIETKLSDGDWKGHGVADHRVRLLNLNVKKLARTFIKVMHF